MSKHTPGPWEFRIEEGQSCIVMPNGTTLFAVTEANGARIVACVNACEGIANPSAVPDLLRWLKACVSQLEHDGYTDAQLPELASVRAAIAKAEGKS